MNWDDSGVNVQSTDPGIFVNEVRLYLIVIFPSFHLQEIKNEFS